MGTNALYVDCRCALVRTNQEMLISIFVLWCAKASLYKNSKLSEQHSPYYTYFNRLVENCKRSPMFVHICYCNSYSNPLDGSFLVFKQKQPHDLSPSSGSLHKQNSLNRLIFVNIGHNISTTRIVDGSFPAFLNNTSICLRYLFWFVFDIFFTSDCIKSSFMRIVELTCPDYFVSCKVASDQYQLSNLLPGISISMKVSTSFKLLTWAKYVHTLLTNPSCSAVP